MKAKSLERKLQQLNLTPRQFAIKLGLKESTIVEWLHGKKEISSSYAQVIKSLLKKLSEAK